MSDVFHSSAIGPASDDVALALARALLEAVPAQTESMRRAWNDVLTPAQREALSSGA